MVKAGIRENYDCNRLVGVENLWAKNGQLSRETVSF